MKKKLKLIIALITILIITAIGIIVLINNINNENSENRNQVDENILQQIEQNALIENLANMSELDRVQTYFGEFLECLESENYNEAYNHLNENFKKNYFETIDKFKGYVKTKYPKNAFVKYTNFERQGEIYILTVSIGQILNKDFQEFEQKIVIRETGVNQFTISLELKEDEINSNIQNKTENINRDEDEKSNTNANNNINNNQINTNILVTE